MNRKRRLAFNTVSSLLFQITTIICGFILPRLILLNFGSEVNGLVNSISQFLAIVAFMELGVGAVVQSSLYKPLAKNDEDQISRVLASGGKFFKRLAVILLLYIIVLILIYPIIAKSNYDYFYVGTLIISMGISSFAQYYFGVVDRLLLTADQKGYIQYNVQTATLILNTLACVLLIKIGASIQIVKLTTSIIYLMRPLYLRHYINTHYKIDRFIDYDEEPIKQKWNGVAQHVAAVVLDQTDTIILTLFSSLVNVSIYSVYHLAVNGVKTLFISMTNGIQSLLGELWAKQEIEELQRTFAWTEWAIHTGVIFVFGCTASLIIPFVRVYTIGVNDTNYVAPVFALLITLANAGHCLRLPYNMMILAGGHYKQTQSNYVIAAVLNIMISVITVSYFGLIGVAIGTLVSMVYQTAWMALYDSKNFIKVPIHHFCKHIIIDTLVFVIGYLICYFFELPSLSVLSWIILAIKVAFAWGLITIIVNLFFYSKYMKRLLAVFANKVFSFRRIKHLL